MAAESQQAPLNKDLWNDLFSEEKNILKPELIDDLYHPTVKSIKIIRYSTVTVTEEIIIEPVYPFYTVHDLKLAIYKKKGEDQSYVPEFQFLAIPYPTVFGKIPYVAADFYWQAPEAITEKKEDIDKGIKIKEPFSFVTSPTVDSRFVDSAGERKALNKQNRKDVLLEELFKKSFFENTPIVLHLFLLRDLLIANPVIQGSQLQHIARIEPLFPDTTPESTGIRLSSERNARFQELYTYFTGKEDLFEKIQSHLPIQIFPEIKSVKLLRFVWPTINKTINLDTIFYERPVSKRLPFIRLLPADDVPVSKICIKENSPLPIPDLEDPCLLLQWAKEKNPHEDAEQDYIFGKIVLDPTMAGTQPIYATLQVSPDGTAAIVIQPLKTQKKIDISYLNFSLKVNVWEAIEPFSFSKTKVDIDRANLMASIKIEKSRGRMTSKEIQKRLGMFRAFFQEIPPLQGEEPLIALRYKAVTNFKNETRIEAFLTQLLERKDIEGANKNEIIQERLAEEFSIPRQDARVAFEQYITKRRQVTAVDPETNTFKPTNNSGIDILIFQQAPYFFFHLYNVDSYKNLQRVLTLLSLMVSIDQEDSVLPHKEEVAIEQASDQAIPTAARAAQEAAASARPVTVLQTDEEDEDLGDVDFGAFDQEEEEEEEAPQAPIAVAAVAAAVPPPAVPARVAAEIPLPASASLTQPTANYFLRKLQAADDSLFLYTKGRPDLKKYVSVCQAPEGRQPLVLDETGYKRMMLEYKDDIDRNEIRILTYGYEKALVSEEKAPLKRYGTEEETEDHIFSVLKYGSDIANQNYYLCSEFYCLRDQLLLRKDQFLEAGTFRENADAEFKGKARAAGHCPFCNGTLIKELDKPGPGQTVYQRPVKKPSAGKRHTHIGFYSKKLHPDGFSLPCCFTMKQTIKSSDDDFRVLNEISKRLARKPELAQVVAPVLEEGQVDEVEEQQEVKVIPNYKSLFNEIYRGEYIVGSEKMPLEIGAKPQIGLLPPSLNQFFNQNTADLVQRVEIAQQLKPKSSGFLRVGVDNRQRYRAESFFAAIAPLSSFPLNSADQVRERLKAQITPKVFIAANHGNLMLEFFDPNFPTFAPSDFTLKSFSNNNFGMYNAAQIAYISRIWRSYMNFKGDKQELTIKDKPIQRKSFMNDPDKLKEYRQFAHLLAQPGIFTFRGILLIVLDMAPDGSVSVRCPPFGINDLMNTCDIGILLHKGDIWEPIFYANYLQGTATTQPRGQGFPRFQKAGYAAWPEVLKIKVDEFRSKCQLQSDPIYTGIQQIKEGAKLIPLSKVNTVLKTVLTGIVRDSYNHVVAVTINVNEEEEDEEKKEPIIITLPVVDDGIIYEGVNVYFNWDGYKAPPADEVIKFYTENQEQLSAYPGYQPEYYVIPKKSEKIQAIQLQNGIYIRVSASKKTPVTLPPPPGGQPELLEYQINKKFALPNDWQIKEGPPLPQEEQIAQIKLIEKEADLEEIYEHFRLTFSNWLSGPDAGQGMRKSIEDIIMKKAVEYIGGDLPLYQKRERLEILLGPTLLSWLDHTTPPGKGIQPLRRIDCRQLPKDSCPKEMRCAWVAEGETGSCRLHTPSQQTSRMFILRLIDELIRFPLRRQELLKENKRSVRTLIDLDGPNRDGTQYVIPEDAIEWSDLMRMDCRQKTKEIPRFLEEMSEVPAVQKVAASKLPPPNEEKPAPVSDLPEALLSIIKPNGADLTLYKWSEDEVEPGKEFDELVVRLGGSPDEFEFADDKTSFTREELNKLAIESRKIVVQIDLRKTPPEVFVKLWAGVKEVFVIVITEEGPKVLVQRNTKPRVLNKSLITFVKKYLEVPLPAA